MNITAWLEELLNYRFYEDYEQISDILNLIMRDVWYANANGTQDEFCERLQSALERTMLRNKERELEGKQC